MNRRRVLRVSDHLRKLLEHEDEPTRVFRRNSTAEFRLGERSFYFVEQRPANDELELTRALRASIADTLCAQARYDEAAELTKVMPTGVSDWIQPHVLWRSARAKALARLGRPDEAVVLAQEAVAIAEPTDGLNLRAGALLDQAEVFRAVDLNEDAARTVDAALQLYERKGNLVMAERTGRLDDLARRGRGSSAPSSDPARVRPLAP